jgi:4-hydroxymandelate oxidase
MKVETTAVLEEVGDSLDAATAPAAAIGTDLPLNLHEFEAAARAVLPPMIFDYIAGGSGDQITLHANCEAFSQWRLLPYVLRGLSEVSLATTVLGQGVSLPVLVAPSGMHRLSHVDGEVATARAAKKAGSIYVMSTPATLAMEEVAPEAGTWWFQLYTYTDRGITRDLIARAAAAGASALVVTVDVPVLGRREADERNRFELPAGLTLANLQAPEHKQLAATENGSGLNSYIGARWHIALSWSDIEWISSLTSLPVVLKGILHPSDAARAFELGASGVIVSNHGGRQLDAAVASLDALPAVVDAVAGRGDVLLDGGVRRGTDVLKALALGARAVLLGRPIHWGLAIGGEAGVSHIFDLMRAELSRDLILCGLAGPGEVDRSLIVPAGPVSLSASTR